MDTGQLVAFDRIVREGGFSRAARALNLTQPTISARIAALEEAVGGPLFVRGGRRLALTERGEAFLPYARRALAVLGEGVEAARLAEAGERGRVTVGIIQSLADALLAPVVTAFAADHPRVELAVHVGHSDDVVRMLQDGVARVGLVAWPVFSPDITPLLRLREPIALVALPEHPLARLERVTLADIAALADPLYILRWDGATGVLLDQLARTARSVAELPSTVTRHLLPRGTGAAFFIRSLVAAELAEGRLVELPVADLGPLFREAAVVRLHGDAPLPAAAQAFVTAVRAHAAALRLLAP